MHFCQTTRSITKFGTLTNNLIAENRCKQLKIRKLRQKNGRGCFNCSENVSQAQNGCKFVKNGYHFAKLRKYL